MCQSPKIIRLPQIIKEKTDSFLKHIELPDLFYKIVFLGSFVVDLFICFGLFLTVFYVEHISNAF